jgi:hypothetical protein
MRAYLALRKLEGTLRVTISDQPRCLTCLIKMEHIMSYRQAGRNFVGFLYTISVTRLLIQEQMRMPHIVLTSGTLTHDLGTLCPISIDMWIGGIFDTHVSIPHIASFQLARTLYGSKKTRPQLGLMVGQYGRGATLTRLTRLTRPTRPKITGPHIMYHIYCEDELRGVPSVQNLGDRRFSGNGALDGGFDTYLATLSVLKC